LSRNGVEHGSLSVMSKGRRDDAIDNITFQVLCSLSQQSTVPSAA